MPETSTPRTRRVVTRSDIARVANAKRRIAAVDAKPFPSLAEARSRANARQVLAEYRR